jgi:hypothetical protein
MAMAERLQANTGFSARVGGRIFTAEPKNPPAVWIGATAFETRDGAIDLIATIHVRVMAAKEAALALIDAVQAAFVEPPVVDGISITSWRSDYHELRLDEEDSAYHGLARFRANAQVAQLPV